MHDSMIVMLNSNPSFLENKIKNKIKIKKKFKKNLGLNFVSMISHVVGIVFFLPFHVS